MTKTLTAVGMISLMSIVLTISVSIIARYIFKKPILWSLELCSVLVVWATYTLFGVDFLEKRHFRIEILTKILPSNILRLLDIFVDVILFIAVIILAISTWGAVELNGTMFLTAMPLSLWIAFYIPFTLGIISHFLYLLSKTILRFSPKGDQEHAAGEGSV